MTNDIWGDTLEKIKSKFEILTEEKTDLEDGPGQVHRLIFESPVGKVKLERIQRPRVLDKKTSYTRRTGSDVQIEYTYDDNDILDYVKAYRSMPDDEWQEIEIEKFYSF